MFETIVLALDGSEGSSAAVPVAADVASRYESRVVIVHVDERVPGKGGVVSVRDQETIQAELRKRLDELTARGIDATLETVELILGGPAQAIEQVAERVGADLIAVGRHGHSPVGGLLLGGVTTRLLHVSKRSVLAAPSSR
jgi:nucleotide-binding universal stress UspA family protein